MQKASWMVLVLSLLLPAAVLADNAETVIKTSQASDLDSLSLRAYWQGSRHAADWQLSMLTEARYFPIDELQPFASLPFRDPGTFARVSKLRVLSFLTFAELGKARLFFGVNEHGLVGIHLGERPGLGDERSAEIARMPYLKNPRQDDNDQ